MFTMHIQFEENSLFPRRSKEVYIVHLVLHIYIDLDVFASQLWHTRIEAESASVMQSAGSAFWDAKLRQREAIPSTIRI